MAIVRADYLSIGGHSWRIGHDRGVQYHWCEHCQVIACMDGSHGLCLIELLESGDSVPEGTQPEEVKP